MIVKKSLYRQLIALALCYCMIALSSAGFTSNALASDSTPGDKEIQMSDISGHWAKNQVGTWVKKGMISGFPDETFRPNNPITRAEFMALVNRAYGFSEKAAINFSDVSESDWFYDDVAKAVAAGYIVGYGDGTAGAGNNISRQEAAAVIYRLMKLPEYSNKDAIAKFSDYGSISAWSREAVNSVVAEGYMVGNPNGTFGPANNITRAETVVTLSRATGEIYNAAGTYSEVRTIKGNATINTTGITLDGAVVEGNLYLTPGIGEGTVVLRNVTVKGTTVIAGGGKNSVILEDCALNKIVVEREDGTVRVSAQGGTTIQIVVVEAGAILDSALLSGDGSILTVYVTADEAVELSGDFDTVHVENPGSVINVTGGSIENLILAETAAGSSVNVSENASVTNMDINAPVTVTGQGTVGNAVIGEGAEETTFEKEPVNKEGPGPAAPSTPPSTTPGGSTGGGSTGGGTGGSTSTIVSIAAIPGVTAPVTGQTPVTTITETAQYSGTVTWSPADGSFAASTVYTATITLTAKSGYRLNGVPAGFFTVAGATSVSNAANSGVITAVFPATVPVGGDVVPPALTADVTGNFPKTNLDIPFTDDIDWRNAVTAVKVDGSPLTNVTQYELSAGKLRLKTNAIPVMQAADTYTVTVEAADYQTVTVSQTMVTGLSGSGTAGDPFTVANAGDLDKVRHYVAVPGLHFKQTANIDLNSIDWQPIGEYSPGEDEGAFMGTYDGDNYMIENMKIVDDSQENKTGSGLFAYTKEARLMDIRLEGVDIDVPNTGGTGSLVGVAWSTDIDGCIIQNSTRVKGHQAVGGLIGWATGSTVSNSRAEVSVIGDTFSSGISNKVGGFIGDSGSSTITGSSAHGDVSGIREVGGFAGYMSYGSIIGCFAEGDVTSVGDTAQDTGGFVGHNSYATADQCYAISTVSGRNYVGGFAGRNVGTITNSYAIGSVSYSDTGAVAGGFVGRIQNNNAGLLGGSSSDTGYNYSDVAITGTGATIGAFLGEHNTSSGSGTIHHNHYNSEIALVNQGSGANGLTLENMKKQASFPEWDFTNVWAIQENVTPPTHRWKTLSDNASLSSLSVVGQSLMPPFAAGTLSYSVAVASAVDAVDIIAVPADTNASMTLNGTHLGMSNPQSVTLGAAGTDTVITVRVTAENGITTKDYIITVSREDQALPQKSVYDILFDHSDIVAGVGKEVEITLQAVEVKDEGYDLVRINVSVTEQPSNSTVALTGNYGDGPVDVIDLGYWGPVTGHPVTANYDMSYNLIALFNQPGQYTLAISLRDMNEDTDILTKNVTLTVAEAAVPNYTLTVQASPSEGGTVSGGGSFAAGSLVDVGAIALDGYTFYNWTLNGAEVSTQTNFSYTMPAAATTLIANFHSNSLLTPPVFTDTEIYAGQSIQIPYVQDNNYRQAISSIVVDGTEYESSAAAFDTSAVDHLYVYANVVTELHQRGTHSITVKAAGYNDATVALTVTAGEPDILKTVIDPQPVGPLVSGGLLHAQPILWFYDAYDNLCVDGPILNTNLEVTGTNLDSANWILGGTRTVSIVDGKAEFTSLTATNNHGNSIDKAIYFKVFAEEYDVVTDQMVIPGAIATYTLTLTGEGISSIPAAGEITENTEVTVTVNPPQGMQVATFKVGVVNKKSELLAEPVNQYSFIINSDTTVTVTYENIPPETYTLTLQASPPEGGSVSGAGSYEENTAVNVSATAALGYQFVNWTVNDVEVSTQANSSYTMPADDTTLVANFQSAGLLIPPVLSPDSTNNKAGSMNISITYTADQHYRNAISAIKVDDIEYQNIAGENNIFESNSGAIVLKGSNIEELKIRGEYSITVKAEGYSDAGVNQVITANVISPNHAIIISGPEKNEYYNSGQALPEIKVQLKDQYGNDLIDGPDDGIELTVDINPSYPSVYLSDTLTAVADSNGQVIFSNVIATLPGEDTIHTMLILKGFDSQGFERTINLEEFFLKQPQP